MEEVEACKYMYDGRPMKTSEGKKEGELSWRTNLKIFLEVLRGEWKRPEQKDESTGRGEEHWNIW